MIVDFGYGVVLDDAQTRIEAANYLLDNFATKEILGEFNEFHKRNSDITSNEEAKEIFAEEYEDDTCCESGLFGLLARCINDLECGGDHIFAYKDHCIYVGARIPANDEEKNKILTMSDIRKILVKYLSPLLENDMNFRFLDIND